MVQASAAPSWMLCWCVLAHVCKYLQRGWWLSCSLVCLSLVPESLREIEGQGVDGSGWRGLSVKDSGHLGGLFSG